MKHTGAESRLLADAHKQKSSVFATVDARYQNVNGGE